MNCTPNHYQQTILLILTASTYDNQRLSISPVIKLQDVRNQIKRGGKFWAAFFHTHSLSFFGNRSTERASGPTCRLSICLKIAASQKLNQIHFIGPCSQRDRDYSIRSNFWKFYLVRTSFMFGELVSVMKLLDCLNWNRCLFWCSECGHSRSGLIRSGILFLDATYATCSVGLRTTL